MRPLLDILSMLWAQHRRAFLIGLALSALAVLAAVALLGLSGWFITASALAGAAGIGIGFDFFRPSAGVRFLALLRTAARYGERVTTHEATLAMLASLRLRLFRGLAARPITQVEGLRRASLLHRLTVDIDALDTVYLRLLAPLLAAMSALLAAGGLLAWLVDPLVAAFVMGCHLLAGVCGLLIGARQAGPSSRRRAAALEAVRGRLIDLARARIELIMAGRLAGQREAVMAAHARAQRDERRLDRLEIRLGALISGFTALAVAGALMIGAGLGLPLARIALGVFSALALGEAVMPLLRGGLELGAMVRAARRVGSDLARERTPLPHPETPHPLPPHADPPARAPVLRLEGVTLTQGTPPRVLLRDVSLSLAPGEWLALTGASGAGKSSLLRAIAGLEPVAAGQIFVLGHGFAGFDGLDEPDPDRIGYLLQRSALFAGTIGENLALAAPLSSDSARIAALKAVCLWEVIEARGGLDMRLGEGGSGLSGGEMRRLALARLILRAPPLLLLDEPTEGLDAPLAAQVLANLRAALPQSAVLLASHRSAETEAADRVRALRSVNPAQK
ncbi:MAG: ATP-binding cassette domain-containing protein [Neomegalonema sp.]|nr:ATP-binding cassette domain-containing protein [Neomegalonema sp.]